MPSKETPTPSPQRSQQPEVRVPERRAAESPYLRATNEDDDGYDPYSDRPAEPDPLFERDPWA